jgi:hypothetical protein
MSKQSSVLLPRQMRLRLSDVALLMEMLIASSTILSMTTKSFTCSMVIELRLWQPISLLIKRGWLALVTS